jgi:hypothetical protein
MKKSMIALAGLAVLSAPAYASKARLTGLGQDGDNGSYYIDDQRNTFLNPATYNQFNNFVIFEWGDDFSDNSSTTTTVNNTSTEAEGGFARQAGSFVYAVYLGNDNGDKRNTVANAIGGTTPTGFLKDNNRIDLSFAGDAGIKWGANIYYSTQSEQVTDTSVTSGSVEADGDTFGLKLGAMADMWSVWAHLNFSDEATGPIGAGTSLASQGTQTAADKYEGDFNWKLGANYKWTDWTFFAEYEADGAEINDANVTTNGTGEWDKTNLVLGAGHTHRLNDMAMLWSDITFNMRDEDFKAVGSTETRTANGWNLKLNVALEAKATSWLKLRGFANQRLFNKDEARDAIAAAPTLESSGTGETEVGAGASLTFGKLMVDGTIATSDGTANSNTGENEGLFNMDELLANVSVHYWF